jgi:hypothetical protein
MSVVAFERRSSLEEICDSGFRWSSLKSIFIPSSVAIFGKQSFSECKSLEPVKLESGSRLEQYCALMNPSGPPRVSATTRLPEGTVERPLVLGQKPFASPTSSFLERKLTSGIYANDRAEHIQFPGRTPNG